MTVIYTMQEYYLTVKYKVSQETWELGDELKVVFDFGYLMHGKENV